MLCRRICYVQKVLSRGNFGLIYIYMQMFYAYDCILFIGDVIVPLVGCLQLKLCTKDPCVFANFYYLNSNLLFL